RVPQAYGILTDPNPPVLARVRSNVTRDEAIRTMATALTTGEERFQAADALARAGRTEEAIRAFEKLCEECRTSWIERVGRERIRELRSRGPAAREPEAAGITALHPGDKDIVKDPRVVFAENFEEASLDDMKKRWETASTPDTLSLSDDVPAGSAG